MFITEDQSLKQLQPRPVMTLVNPFSQMVQARCSAAAVAVNAGSAEAEEEKLNSTYSCAAENNKAAVIKGTWRNWPGSKAKD